MDDSDGPVVAETVYTELVNQGALDLDTIPFALDQAMGKLRSRGVHPHRWAPFVHIGA